MPIGRLKDHVRARVATWVHSRDEPGHIRSSIDRMQKLRSLIDEVQEGFWHELRLPSRDDVRRLRRRVAGLRRQIRALEAELAGIEALLESRLTKN